MSEQIVVLRERRDSIEGSISSNEQVNNEIEDIKKKLEAQDGKLFEYNDKTIRLLVKYIRVMHTGQIIIMLKGGLKIEERL